MKILMCTLPYNHIRLNNIVLNWVINYPFVGFQLVTFPTDAIVKEGSKFTLECTFSSPPILTTWLFNDVDTNITVPISNSSTLVRTASTETAGYYRCEASYQLGKVVSEPALIQIGCEYALALLLHHKLVTHSSRYLHYRGYTCGRGGLREQLAPAVL